MSTSVYPFSYDVFIESRAQITRIIALAWNDPAVKKALKKDPRKAFKTYLNYDFPYKDITLHTTFGNAEWSPNGFGDWVVKENETIELVLPPPPADIAQQPEALMTYNARHLSPAS